MSHRSSNPNASTLLLDENPVIHSQTKVELAKELLRAGGFTIFSFTYQDVQKMVRDRGWRGWLEDRSFVANTAEPVWFHIEPGMGRSQVLLLLGALHRSERS